ncbi:GNAT family N-acetyltransferase [bacterium]|nr:GNAT family N-acetyltransferase [bacterium]
MQLDYLELRGGYINRSLVTPRDHYYSFRLDLSPGPEALLSGMRKSMRRAVKRSLENGLTMETIAGDGAVDEFYRLHARDMRRFGTPVQSRRWIEALCSRFPEHHRFTRVKHRGKVVAMFLIRKFADTVSEVIGNDLPAYRDLTPNIFIEWQLIRTACSEGFRYYNFGRSIRESGTYFFKEGWNAVPVPLPYGYYLHRGRSIPDTSQSSGSRTMIARIWKRLPLAVVNRVGPKIRWLYP